MSSADAAQAGAPKLRVERLRKTFVHDRRELVVLDDLELTVRAGEFVCVLGPSGCGKSTLLNIVGGFDTPTSGRVTIDGETVTGPSARRVFVFQEYGIFPWATVRENVALGLAQHAASERARIVDHYLALVGLRDFEHAYPAQLSGGMKQRVAVARALAVSPDVIFMDEPLGALDSLTRLALRREILSLWQRERMTVLFVTHDVDEALQLADRIVVLSARPARIVDIVTVDEAHPRDIAGALYGRTKTRLYELLGVNHAV